MNGFNQASVLQHLFSLQQAQAQSEYVRHLLNAQMSAGHQQYAPPLTPAPPATSEVAAEARQGLLIEGTARRIDAA